MKYTISIHTKHDANMTISGEGEIVEYIEFEKVVGVRYFCFSEDIKFEREFSEIIYPFLKKYKNSIKKINFCWLSDFQKKTFIEAFPNCKIDEKEHHLSHAYSLFAFTKPRESDLIISFDGGGDKNDFFKIFQWENCQIKLLREIKLNLGTPYRFLGMLTDEIKSSPTFKYDTNHHLPGKIMGLAPLGKVVEQYLDPLRDFYLEFGGADIKESLKNLLRTLDIPFDENLKIDREIARNILRTSQKILENLFFENLQEIYYKKFERILLAGGCALNIKLNTEIYKRTKKEIFVSPVPSDCGISIGAVLSDIKLEHFKPLPNAFIGLEFEGDLSDYIEKLKPIKVNAKELAKELAEGKIIGTIINKMEAGPRALGNHSLLASPLKYGVKDKLNRIKERESFRPVATMVLDKKQDIYFEKSPISKYMSFSPKIRCEFNKTLSEVVHFDKTCRIQTVTKEEGFIYQLITEFEKQTGIGILINTSLNIKGKPILNNLKEAFRLLETLEIDGLYIEGFLFKT